MSVAVMKYGSAIIVAVLNASIFLGWERRCCTAIRGACVGLAVYGCTITVDQSWDAMNAVFPLR